jgi:type VI secretion system protein ImpJ
MFLRPQHLQTAQRHGAYLASQGAKWDLHYNWGMRSVEIDPVALGNYQLVIHSLKARLRDGTLVAVPEDGLLPTIDLKEPLAQARDLTVSLAVPRAGLGKANVASNGASDTARYLVVTQELEDENTGINPQPVEVRSLNLKLLLSTQNPEGYEVIPVIRVQKPAKADATPEEDPFYIPPVLACDAWKTLQVDILQAIYHTLGKRIDLLAKMVEARRISFDSRGQGEVLILAYLRAMNEAYALLGTLAYAEGVHPLPAYLELCRLVGQLAVFGDTHRPPELPKYDHDDLGGCFYAVKRHVEALLYTPPDWTYQERPYVGAGLRMQVSLEPSWLEPTWQMFVGVESQLPAEECIRLLTRTGPGGLNMKMGSSDRVDDIFRLGRRGLDFVHSPRPPTVLPTRPDLVYFQVNRDSQQDEWNHIKTSLTMAIRLSERLIASSIQGQRELTIRTEGGQTTMNFTLYVVPENPDKDVRATA